eukprot:jgi/Astpho2/2471/Aster-04196
MADFKGVSERFNLQMLSEDGYDSDRVVVVIGLDGLLIKTADGSRTLRKYPLNHISRWALRGSSLVLYTKLPADVEERTVTLQASEGTIRSVLDTLTSCCMQMCELLESSNTSEQRQAATSITNLLSGGARKKASLPAQEDVEFWHKPEKMGWLQSQGEHLRTWRRRWFVLKQGFLFRFGDQNVVASSKPRGIVDLSKVTDVCSGRDTTGKPNSITLSTATGAVHYVADSETEQVEWLSALEGAVSRIVRLVAGVDDEEPAPASKRKTSRSDSGGDRNWAQQLESSFAAHSIGGGGGGGSSRGRDSAGGYDSGPSQRDSRKHKDTMVSVIGYDSASAPPSGRDGGGSRGGAGYPGNYAGMINDEFGATDYGGGGINYSQIAA